VGGTAGFIGLSFLLMGVEGFIGGSSSKVEQTELSRKIIAELKRGDGNATKSFSTDYLTVIYSPDPFGKAGECQISINYFDGEQVVSGAHPRTKMFYQLGEGGALIAIPNIITSSGGAIRVKGNGSDEVIKVDDSAVFGGDVGRMQVASKGTSEFDDLLEIMLSSSEIVVGSGEFLGQRALTRFKMKDFTDAYAAIEALCAK
jgi:hypothetical protein